MQLSWVEESSFFLALYKAFLTAANEVRGEFGGGMEDNFGPGGAEGGFGRGGVESDDGSGGAEHR